MAYAVLSDVLARAGRLATAWDADTTPSSGDLEDFVVQAADELDAAMAALGISVPVTTEIAVKGLLGLNADMALLVAIDATWPGGRGGDDVAEARKAVKDRVDRALASFTDPTHRLPAVAYLLALAAGDDFAGDAANFWERESDYGLLGSSSIAEAFTISPAVQPQFRKGQRL